MRRLACECGRVLGYEPRHAGKTVKCSGCGQPLKVPAEDGILPVRAEEEESPKPAPPPPRQRMPRRRESEDTGWEDPSAEARRGAGALTSLANYVVRNPGVPLVLFFGWVLIPVGIYNGAFSSWSGPARPISVTELADKGPGSNRNVIVTGARAGATAVLVHESKNHIAGKMSREEVRYYTPLLPAAGGGQDIRVILVVEGGDGGKERLAAALAKNEYQGAVVNAITSLEQKAQDFLRQQYPATDFSKVVIVEAGHVAWSGVLTHLCAFAGVLCLVMSLGMWAVMVLYRTE